MGFPKEGLISKQAYASRENQESLNIAVWEKDAAIIGDIQVNYYGYLNPGFEENNIDSLETYIGSELEFEAIQGEEQTLYIAYFEDAKEPDYEAETYGYAGYLQNNKSAGGIVLIYTSFCEKNCEQLKETDLKQAYEWMKSVKFIPHDNHE